MRSDGRDVRLHLSAIRTSAAFAAARSVLSWLYIAAFSNAAPAGSLHLRVETPAPTRFYLTDTHSKSWTPDAAIHYQRRGEDHFVVKNGFDIQLPPGVYSLLAERGPEFRPFRATIDAHPDGSRPTEGHHLHV